MSRVSSRAARASLVFALLLFVAAWILYPHELVASDPWNYSRRAFDISRRFDFGDTYIFGQRLAVTVPVALLYSVFGVGIHATNLWPLCAALMIMAVVWVASPDDGSRVAGMALCVTCVPLFRATTALWPDAIAAAFMAWSSLVLFNRRRLVQGGTDLWVPIAAVALLFVGGLAKESAAWTLPLWILALASDLRRPDRETLLRRFHVPAIVVGLVLAAGYLAFCWLVWSDPFVHFQSVDEQGGRYGWWSLQTAAEHLDRLTIGPVRLLLTEYGAPLLLLAAGGTLVRRPPSRPWACYTGWCLLLYWFGSISFNRYAPLPLTGRYTLPLLPGLLVLAALAASSLATRVSQIAGPRATIAVASVALVLVGLPLLPRLEAWRGRPPRESLAMAIVRREVADHPREAYLLICSDQRSPKSLAFHFGYRYPSNLVVVSVEDLTEEMLGSGRAFVFRDRSRSLFLETRYGEPHHDDEIEALGLERAYQSGDVVLFKSERASELAPLLAARRRAHAQGSSRCWRRNDQKASIGTKSPVFGPDWPLSVIGQPWPWPFMR